ncbi:MAG: epoxyqueuosine reductase QueH [Alphaproteobacteria bacterium]|nr:epoxyqueuosine reductase QueH [Alphaproteobacteria bacterium]
MRMKKEKLLLLSCCAPCSIGVITDLHQAGCDFTVLFYNPNIRPEAEYIRRRDENKRVCDELGVPFVELAYDNAVWIEATKGLENEPERGKRCDQCFLLRLKAAARYAKKNGFTKFSSVLGISRYKDFDQVCRAGRLAATEVGIPYDETNWRKNGGEAKANRLSKEKNLYRQTYCGCNPR